MPQTPPLVRRRSPDIARAAGQAVERLEVRQLMSASLVQYHNDPAGTGVNPNETLLTPGNVNTQTFGKTFTTPVDGQVYAQPLYLPKLSVQAGGTTTTHDVTFVATEHDTLYAIDADGGTVLWQTSFLDKSVKGAAIAGATAITTVPQVDVRSNDITTEIGITSTPVIDAAAGVIYVTAKTKQVAPPPGGGAAVSHYVQTLNKVDVHTGAVIASTVIADTSYDGSTYTYNSGPYTPGTGDGYVSVNGQNRVYYNALRQLIRPALTLVKGQVVIASGSHGDNGPYHGWVLSYDQNSLANTGAFNTSPNGGESGLWESGEGVVVDPQGYLYVVTGNGSFNKLSANFDANGFQKDGDYSNAILKLDFDPSTNINKQTVNGYGIKLIDYFAPYNETALNGADRDLGSGGITILPDSAGSAAHPHLLVQAGKEGKVYLIDRDHLGKFDYTTNKVVQEQASAINGSLSTPAFFNNTLYWVGAYGDQAKTFTVKNATLSTAPTSTSAESFNFPGSTPTISANGTANAVVWTVDRNTAQLRAYDASKGFGKLLWTSGQSGNRDALPSVTKFAVPTVADGRVYLGTLNSLVAFGPPAPATTAPPAPSKLTATASSGIAVNLAWADNANNEAGFRIDVSSDGGKTFATLDTASVNTTTYTANNLQAGGTYTFRVSAYNPIGTSAYSNTATATTTATPPAIDFSAGFAAAPASLQLNGTAAVDASALVLTNGQADQTASAFAKTRVNAARFSTRFTFQVGPAADADGFAFVLQSASPTAVGIGGVGLGYEGITPSAAVKFDLYNNVGEGANSTGLYVNGDEPTTAGSRSLDGTGIDLHGGTVIAADVAYDGTTLTVVLTDTVTGAKATQTYAVDLPARLGGATAYAGFTAATGGLAARQRVLTWTFNPAPTSTPAAPTNLAAVAASGTAITLTWADNATNEAGYKIYRSTDGKTYAVVANAAANATTYTDGQLLADTRYYYNVAATNALGDSAQSASVTLVTPVPPLTPVNLRATAVSATSVTLAWTNRADNATGYAVLRAAKGDSQYNQVATLGPNATGYVDNGVKPGTSYNYHVQNFNAAGYSDFTGLDVATPAATTPTPTPTPTGTRLTGTTFGTAGSWNSGGNTVAKATDGNTATYFDAPTANGDVVGIDLGTAATVTQIRFAPRAGYAYRTVGGRFQASNDAGFANAVTAYTINAVPVDNTLTTVTPNTSAAYRYWRYAAPDGGYGNIAEFQLFGTATTVGQLTGTTIGTAGSWSNRGDTKDKATDGNLSTFFDAPDASGGFVGLDLGSSKPVGQIKFAPRNGYAGRMVGGTFQASNDAGFANAVTVYTVPAAPSDGTLTTVTPNTSAAYRYWRYVGPNGSYTNIAEFQLFGTAAGTPSGQLTGTTFGTAGSYANSGNTAARATDGSLATFFDAPTANAFIGIDLGSARSVSRIKYAPRAGYAYRVVGGTFQASNDANFAAAVTVAALKGAPADNVLSTVTPSTSAAYRYWRYVGPDNGYGDLAEFQLFA